MPVARVGLPADVGHASACPARGLHAGEAALRAIVTLILFLVVLALAVASGSGALDVWLVAVIGASFAVLSAARIWSLWRRAATRLSTTQS